MDSKLRVIKTHLLIEQLVSMKLLIKAREGEKMKELLPFLKHLVKIRLRELYKLTNQGFT
jgi:hypothetical protein